MKNCGEDLRGRIVLGRARGESAEELARLFGVSKRSVERYWKSHKTTGSVAAKQRGGYRHSRLAGHEESLRSWIDADRSITLEELKQRLHKELGIKLGINALWNRLDQLGLSYKKNAPRRRARSG